MRFLEKVFSVKNENFHKIITILGIKLKFINKNQQRFLALKNDINFLLKAQNDYFNQVECRFDKLASVVNKNEQTLNNLECYMGKMEQHLICYDESLKFSQNKIQEIDKKVILLDGVTQTLDGNEKRLSDIENRLGSLNTNVAEVSQKVILLDGVAQTLDGNEKRLSDIENRLGLLNTNVTGFSQKVNILYNNETQNERNIIAKYQFALDFVFKADTKTYYFKNYNNYETRNISTIKMLSLALSRVKNQLNNSFTIRVSTNDCAPEQLDENIWAYARNINDEKTQLIPDFFFDCWNAIGCVNYDDWMKVLIEKSAQAYEFDKIFWSGVLAVHPTREMFYQMSQNNDKIDCLPINWSKENYKEGQSATKNSEVSLLDFPKYKYLIDLPCRGYSGRFKTLLFTGRPVFKVKTDIEEYFYKDLQPFVHYIPVENDLSDLEQKIQWAEENYEKALEIAAKAQEYAKTNLTFESAISYLEKMILAVGKK